MNYSIHFKSPVLKGDVFLPFSKSISNRLLVINAFTNQAFKIFNLSESDDTRHMKSAFDATGADVADIGHAGTAMRFLTAYFAAAGIEKIITGSERMKNRPIGELVNALNTLGANIVYVEKEGYPPLKTSGKPLVGDTISLRGSISSQYITALLLVAPQLQNGLTIRITDKLISSSYVRLTLQMMRYFGVESHWEGNVIRIPRQDYKPKDYTVEADWSGASYWYQLAMLAEDAELSLHGLFADSAQGDAAIAGMFSRLGVATRFEGNKVVLSKSQDVCTFFEADFIDSPDMVQTFVVALCLKGVPFRITGAQSLRIKETDRIFALQKEMSKLGYTIEEPEAGTLSWDGEKGEALKNIAIDTYDDHRMALAFAPAALYFPGMVINNAEVVTKSYPQYWEQFREFGANMTEI